jgi:hypothetical protein
MSSLGIVEVLILLPIVLITLSLPVILIFAFAQLRQFGKRLEALESQVEKLKNS